MSHWKAGNLVTQQARANGDWRGVMLIDRHKSLGHDAQFHDNMALGSAGVGLLAVTGMVAVAGLASSAVLAPVAAAVTLSAMIGVAAGSAFLALVSKGLATHERATQSKLTSAVSQLDRGYSLESVIENLGGAKIAAKLGGWRHSRPKTDSAEPQAAAPRQPGM